MPTSQHQDDVEGHSDGHQSTSADTCMHAPTLDRELVGRALIDTVEGTLISAGDWSPLAKVGRTTLPMSSRANRGRRVPCGRLRS